MTAPMPSTLGHLQASVAGLPDGYGVALSIRHQHGIRRASDKLVTRHNVEAAARRVVERASVADIYLSCTAFSMESWGDVVARGRGHRGRKGDAAAIYAVWADIDIAGPGHSGDALPGSVDAVEALLALLPRYSLVVWTAGGFHVWWYLRDAFLIVDDESRARAARLCDEWVRTVAKVAHAAGYGIDAGVGDMARILRICGTQNRKLDTPRPVRLHDCGQWPTDGICTGTLWRPGPLYTVEELEAHLDPLPPERAAPSAPAAASSTPRPIGGDGPGFLDAVNAASWADCWPRDWSFVGHGNVDGVVVELWRRPGASSDYSAKCWGDGCYVHSEQVPGLPPGGYSKATVLAWRLGLTRSELASAIGTEARRTVRGGRR